MPISRSQCEYDLRSGGLTHRILYLGFFPVILPVHEMTPDMRTMALKYSIETLSLMAKKMTPQPKNAVLQMVLGDPKLIAKHVDITISAKFISLIHDDEKEKDKNGNLMLRVPMKFTSVIERVEHTDCFAFIAKKLDGSHRRCAVFKTEKIELADDLMDIMQHAMAISNEESEEVASGSDTPQAVTPVAPSIPFPGVSPTTPTVQTPMGSLPRRQAPLSTQYIRLGPRATELTQYRWYHGLLSRNEAVARLKRAGEFLIRESENQRGQVILTGMNDQEHEKHLLLIDSEGKVKTQDKEFGSIAELIIFYMRSGSTIVMANENQLRLQFPVDRPH